MARRKREKRSFTIDARKASRLITFLGILSATALTVFVWVIYQPGRHTHKRLLTDSTTFRLTLQPNIAQDYITSLAPGVTRFIGAVPKFTSMQARAFRVDWIHALPYEISFLLDQADAASPGMTVYVNPIPDNDSFVGEVNGWGALNEIQGVRWAGAKLVPDGEQQYIAKGALAVPGDAAQLLQAWQESPGSLYPFDGGRLIDLAADNGKGVLLALHRAFRQSLWDWAAPETNEALVALWPQVARVQVHGDLTRDDELTFAFKLVGNNGLDQAFAGGLIDAVSSELAAFLAERAEMTFSGGGGVVKFFDLRGHLPA